jgi:hypothetical protein
LRALLVGLLAFILVTQAAAAATKAPSSQPRPAAKTVPTTKPSLTLEQQLKRTLASLHRYQGTVRFFRTHRSLLSSAEHQESAKSTLAYAERRIPPLSRTVSALRVKIRARDARRVASLPPRAAICEVFENDCQAAIAVAWCESHLQTTAQNGQYLGLFQMGSYERRLFGHGPSAHAQAVAAHRYFVRSGRDWSPWSCRWAAA